MIDDCIRNGAESTDIFLVCEFLESQPVGERRGFAAVQPVGDYLFGDAEGDCDRVCPSAFLFCPAQEPGHEFVWFVLRHFQPGQSIPEGEKKSKYILASSIPVE